MPESDWNLEDFSKSNNPDDHRRAVYAFVAAVRFWAAAEVQVSCSKELKLARAQNGAWSLDWPWPDTPYVNPVQESFVGQATVASLRMYPGLNVEKPDDVSVLVWNRVKGVTAFEGALSKSYILELYRRLVSLKSIRQATPGAHGYRGDE